MKNHSHKNNKQPTTINRLQLASKSIAENIEQAKNTFYKPPQYCEHCSKLNQSSITFKPVLSPSQRFTRTRAFNLRVDPYSSSFPGILETQNLRLIQINKKSQEQKEQILEIVNRLVSQCKVYVQNYDSNRATTCLQNIFRAVGGNVMVGFIDEQKTDNEWKSLQAQKIKNEYLQKSMQTLKRIIQRNSEYFPSTMSTLKQKYYFSLQDFDQDISNISVKKDDNQNLMQLFQIRLNDFIEQLQTEKKGRRMGLFQNQFQKIRTIIIDLKQTILQNQQQLSQKLPLIKQFIPEPQIQQKQKHTVLDQDIYMMILNQSLVIEEFLSQQNDE